MSPNRRRKSEILRIIFNPRKVAYFVWRKFPIGPFSLRLQCDAVPRPQYAYCMYEAALLAARLGISRIAAIEFGVAKGAGLLAMEKIADEIEAEVPVEFQIFGFDTGSGLPKPSDYRDIPYAWQEGEFKMDEDNLRRQLRRAQLVIGNVKNTVPSFINKFAPAPIAMISFDLDYYSSTSDALKIFDIGQENLLPRTYCYFDDIIVPDWFLCNEWVGQLLAIKEFNEQNEMRKIAPVNGLRHKRIVQNQWNDQIYVFHDFEREDYNIRISPKIY